MKDWLIDKGSWPLAKGRLIAYRIHLPRAKIVFAQTGFKFDASVAVNDSGLGLPSEQIVPRLWYYRSPPVHWAYEALAITLSFLRVI